MGVPLTPASDLAVQAMYSCRSAEMRFLNCPEMKSVSPIDNGFKGTTVIMDTGLTSQDWFYLEENNLVDIIRYQTVINGVEYGIGEEGRDCYITIDCASPILERQGIKPIHGSLVTSAFGTIAKGAPVIFMDFLFGTSFGYGFYDDQKPWQWILDNIDTYQIKVLSISLGVPDDPIPQVVELIEKIADAGVTIIGAIGNDGQNRGLFFPVSHGRVFGVGSIDHENRGEWREETIVGMEFYYFDHDYKSRMGYFSGLAEEASLDYVTHQGEHPNCNNGNELPFCSSYGSPTYGNRSTDFVMPGHGVVVAGSFGGVFVHYYGVGTSFSAPYLAAAALIGYHAYAIGYYGDNPPTYPYVSVSTIYNLLKGAASRSIWHQLYGWGFINLEKLFTNAKELGKPLCDALAIKFGLC